MDQLNNPFQPPSADISPPEETFGHGTLLSKPRQVAMMRSWLWYRLSYRLLIKRPGLLMGSTFLVLLLTVGLASALALPLAGLFPGIQLVFGLIVTALSLCLYAGMMHIANQIEQGKDTRLADLFAFVSPHIMTAFALALIYQLLQFALQMLVFVAFTPYGADPVMIFSEEGFFSAASEMHPLVFTLFWMLLTVVALLCFSLIWVVPALLAHHKLPIMTLMRLSAMAFLRNIPAMIVFGVLTSLFFVLASLPFLLGWIFMAPMMVLTQHFAYRDLLTSSAVSM